jgi:hypothetical protein
MRCDVTTAMKRNPSQPTRDMSVGGSEPQVAISRQPCSSLYVASEFLSYVNPAGEQNTRYDAPEIWELMVHAAV